MLEDNIDDLLQEIESYLQEKTENLKTEYGIPIDVNVRPIQQIGFISEELTVIAVNFLLSEITKGVLRNIGKDIWRHIKFLFGYLTQKKEPMIQFVISFRVKTVINGNNYTFVCQFDPKHQVEKFDLFVENLPGKMESVESSINGHLTIESKEFSLEFLSKDTWREMQVERKANEREYKLPGGDLP